MRFTLIHPSRGRAVQANKTLNYWLERISGKHEIEYLLSLDTDDSQLDQYKTINHLADERLSHTLVFIGDNNSVVEATNRAAAHATGDVLIYLSDDFECPHLWDLLLFQKLEKLDPAQAWLLKVDDALQKFDVDVLTIPIMSIGLYKRLGYFWHKEYKSMFVDQDLYHTCRNNEWLIFAPDLTFPHLHYSNGKAVLDTTYQQSSENWTQGQRVYHRRMRDRFPMV